MRIVAVNLGGGAAQGLVRLSSELPGDPANDGIVFEDQLNGQRYSWSRNALRRTGLYVKLEKGASHVFRIV